ncbi:Crp/Fnr family transcriptional regulator [Bradyrhizobium archetypum]|uniref:Crp/Fnr family transcriptional regulator n=1 Tax=Bradyrhizobium archetypum TaxID=2721160 RepID=A0A7Y4M2N2_9BRAD|nr:Crp/Fnr family transcriptional regulator [Bradyrhizobium archetypum]NOJ47596.1 Crp/Fnr family transcriptional regulator [Bradyrhizobium archetypum]
METGRPYSRLLFRLERFNELTTEDRQRIADLPLKLVNYPAGRDVLSHGYATSQCTLVLDGFLFSHKPVSGSRRQITSFFVPGDVADLATLYLPAVDHSITTLGPAVLAFVPHTALKEAADRSTALTQAFWRETLMQAAILQEWIVNLGRRDAFARIAHIVCELTVRLQASGMARDLSFAMPWTQTDVADACGISNVHANRVIQEMRYLGLVDWNSRRLTIRDWNALMRLGDFNDDYLQYCASIKKDYPLTGHAAPEGGFARLRTSPLAYGVPGGAKSDC